MASPRRRPTGRVVLQIPERFSILCGIAIGYEDEGVKVNRARSPRVDVSDSVSFVS